MFQPHYPTAIRFESEIESTFEKRIYGPLQERHHGRRQPQCGPFKAAAFMPTLPTSSSLLCCC